MTAILEKQYDKKTVAISRQHWELLKLQGHVTESMNDVIGRLLKSVKTRQVPKSEGTEHWNPESDLHKIVMNTVATALLQGGFNIQTEYTSHEKDEG